MYADNHQKTEEAEAERGQQWASFPRHVASWEKRTPSTFLTVCISV
jgi:hypothetical protein